MRFLQTLAEQPHLPHVVAVADFQQLQPVVSGGHCQKMVLNWPMVTLDTAYRSQDSEHLLFQNRIREQQPSREVSLSIWRSIEKAEFNITYKFVQRLNPRMTIPAK